MYPKLIDIYLENLSLIAEDSLETLFNEFQTVYISQLLTVSFDMLVYIHSKKLVFQNANVNQYDLFTTRISNIIYSICCYW